MSLPLPGITTSRKRHYPLSIRNRYDDDNGAKTVPFRSLLNKSRIVNLALFGVFAISLFMNASTYLKKESSDIVSEITSVCSASSVPPMTPDSIDATLGLDAMPLASHLIIVPGHAIWTGSNAADASTTDDDWILQPVQRGGTVRTFVEHVKRGIHEAIQDPSAVLIFSGGQTRQGSIFTEASSYARLAAMGHFYEELGHSGEFNRVTTEDFALDSYQNLIFSVARFKEFTGQYPSKITVIGFDMKEARFRELHRKALRWAGPFEYIGIHDEFQDPAGVEGERLNGYELYEKDLYGCHGTLLEKRRSRNVYRRFHPYHVSCPAMQQLLEYCPSDATSVFPLTLPWKST